jgi:hypothetical protein
MSPILQTLANSSAYGYRTLAGAEAGAYESIATVTVGSGGSSQITFTSIPSTYQHLQIRAFARSAGSNNGENTKIYVNNSSASTNYAWHVLRGNGSGVTAAGGGGNYIVANVGTANATSVFSGMIIDFLDYADTNKNKTIRNLYGFDSNGEGIVGIDSVLVPTTSAISQIDIFMDFNFTQYSSFALYGIKG